MMVTKALPTVVALLWLLAAHPTNAQPRSIASPSPLQAGGDAHRFSGAVTVNGEPVTQWLTVVARISGSECGAALVDALGRYTLDVVDATQEPGCGRASIEVQFALRPQFGSEWSLPGAFPFASGGTSRVDVDIDLRTLPADASNVALMPWHWDNLSSVPIGVCGQARPETRAAADEAITRWMQATSDMGLRAGLIRTPTACGEAESSIVIGDLSLPDEPGVVGRQQAFERIRQDCEPALGQRCRVIKSYVVLNTAAPLTPDERVRTLMHEIGHALGLGHAHHCSGGTIMFDDIACRFPGTTIGVDDIAALNRRFAEHKRVNGVP